MKPLRIALAQLAPRLGVVEDNLRRHRELLGQAREGGANLCVFPELGLTGYLLQDLNAEVAMRADDARLLQLASEAAGMSTVVGFVEESDDHRLFISAALLEDGAVRHVHRKVFLPTYGLFDERRFFAAGSVVRAAPSALGVPLGIAVCEDFWHLSVPELLALDGAQILINISSSPGRDVAAINEVGLGTASSWWTLMRTYAQLTTTFVVFVNRVGVDESITFWGGSEVVGPAGEEIFRAPLHDEALYFVDIDLDEVRRERISLPLLRDERPEVILRQLERIIRTRSGEGTEATETPDRSGTADSPAQASSPQPSDGRGQARGGPSARDTLDVARERRR
jgi:NAD+ synthase (glutamine-hydrolysing)